MKIKNHQLPSIHSPPTAATFPLLFLSLSYCQRLKPIIKKLLMRQTLLILLLISCILSCRKHKNDDGGITPPYFIPSPYSYPVWHPNGQILGFNHTPLKLLPNQDPIQYLDSTGFWLINTDGTNKRRVLNFQLYTPAWSPDGTWLAYSDGANIYKIRYNGVTFDTTQNIRLTSNGKSFFPSWNDTGDSIAFDSWDGGQYTKYRIWKMKSDGNGKIELLAGRQPRWSGNYIYFIGSDSAGIGVFQSKTSGRITKNIFNQPNPNQNINNLRILNNFLLLQAGGLAIYKIDINNRLFNVISNDQIDDSGFDISPQGKIAYVLFNLKVTTTQGTIWLMNIDGSNKHQLTFNNY